MFYNNYYYITIKMYFLFLLLHLHLHFFIYFGFLDFLWLIYQLHTQTYTDKIKKHNNLQTYSELIYTKYVIMLLPSPK